MNSFINYRSPFSLLPVPANKTMVGVTDIVTEGSSEIILRTVFISCGFFSLPIGIANRSMRNKKGYLATLLSAEKPYSFKLRG